MWELDAKGLTAREYKDGKFSCQNFDEKSSASIGIWDICQPSIWHVFFEMQMLNQKSWTGRASISHVQYAKHPSTCLVSLDLPLEEKFLSSIELLARIILVTTSAMFLEIFSMRYVGALAR